MYVKKSTEHLVTHNMLNRKDRVYVAGPMSGVPEHNYPLFFAVSEWLSKEHNFRVENPAENGRVPEATWGDYLRVDIQRLCSCDTIALLPGWEQSGGAQFEYEVASRLGLSIIAVFADKDADGEYIFRLYQVK